MSLVSFMSAVGSKSSAAICAAMLVALAACDDVPQVVPGHIQSDLTRSMVRYVQARGPLLVEVYGDPFAAGQETVADAVVLGLDGEVQAPRLRFTRIPEEAGASNVVYRISFNYPQSAHVRHLCGTAPPTAAPGPRDRIEVVAALCLDGEPISSAGGSVGKVQDPNDEAFQKLNGYLVRAILDPSENN